MKKDYFFLIIQILTIGYVNAQTKKHAKSPKLHNKIDHRGLKQGKWQYKMNNIGSMAEGFYINDTLDGKFIFCSNSSKYGQLCLNGKLKMGIPFSRWYTITSNSDTFRSCDFKNGQLVSIHYYHQNQLNRSLFVDNGYHRKSVIYSRVNGKLVMDSGTVGHPVKIDSSEILIINFEEFKRRIKDWR